MMTKNLIIATALSAVAVCAHAEVQGVKLTKPTEIPGAAISRISPDGRYAVSEDPTGVFIVYDLQAGDAWMYLSDDQTSTVYSAGLGQPFSATGILVGCTTEGNTASYWEKGEWKSLPMPSEWKGVLARGINRDASVIVGTANLDVAGPTTELTIAAVPCIWHRRADGSYGMPELLPYPELDFSGRVPQYITAMTVSDDGKSVLGQVRDFSGVGTAPIRFTCDGQGKWSYDYFGADLVNPDHTVFPEWVDDDIVPPVATDYMDDMERAQYEQAIADGLEPDESEYMTPEKWEEYSLALEDYNDKVSEQGIKQQAFFNVLYEVLAKGMQFEFNNQYANADGTVFATTRLEARENPEYPEFDITVYSPYRFKIAPDGKVTYEKLGEGYNLSDIADDGTVLMTKEEAEMPPTAYAGTPDGDVLPLEEYIANSNVGLGRWIESTMTHEITSLDGETTSFLITGYPHASADLKIFSCATDNYWNFEQGSPNYYSYLFGIDMEVSGVEAMVGTAAATVKAMRGGRIEVTGTADIEVYSPEGTRLFGAKAATGTLQTNLSGLVLIKATDAEGNQSTLKAIL